MQTRMERVRCCGRILQCCVLLPLPVGSHRVCQESEGVVDMAVAIQAAVDGHVELAIILSITFL